MNDDLKSKFISGQLLQKEYKIRRLEKDSRYIKKEEPTPEGWRRSELKRFDKIEKDKAVAKLLEDSVWCLFYELGIINISEKEFTITFTKSSYGKYSKQLDVVAYNDEVIFVVECKSQRSNCKKADLNDDIRSLASIKSNISQNLQCLGHAKLHHVYILATHNIVWTESNRLCAKEHKIHIFDEYDIMGLRELAQLAGNAAIYQIYNRIFYDQKIKNFRVKIPGLESRMGDHIYYTFNMIPEHLLKIAFVHQRRKVIQFHELSDSYQRMLNPTRLKQIEFFINAGGYFPGSIILNFTRDILTEKMGKAQSFDSNITGKTRPVILTLPPYYGCAWIIDGQHRLYGYADTDRRFTETLPVVAFVKESSTSQAKLFVDINKNQKSIETDLLWDLYEDLFADSNSEKERHLWAVSKLTKALNQSGPFKGKISVPKEGNEGVIDLKTFCRALHSLNFIGGMRSPFFESSYENSIEFAHERISAFFEIFETSLNHLWTRGKAGFICSTAGIGVLLRMLRDFLNGLQPSEITDLEKFKAYFYDIMFPLICHLENADQGKLEQYSTASVGRKQSSELQEGFTRMIVEEKAGSVRSPFLANLIQSRDEKEELSISGLIGQPESENLEVKGALSFNIDRFIKGDGKLVLDPKLAFDGALKTVAAFLNTNGGNLILGLIEKNDYPEIETDASYDYPTVGNYYIFGIEKEIECQKGANLDKFQLKIRDLIDSHLGKVFGLSIEIKCTVFKGRTICQIIVPSLNASDWCYVDNDLFFVREGNRTKELKGREVDDYKKLRLGR